KYRLNIHNKIAAIHSPTKGPFGRAIESLTEVGKEISSTPEPAGPPAAPKKSARSAPNLPNAQSGQPTPVQVVETPDNNLDYVRKYVAPALKPLAAAVIVVVFTI